MIYLETERKTMSFSNTPREAKAMQLKDNENSIMKTIRNAGRYLNGAELLRRMAGRRLDPEYARRVLEWLLFGHGNDDDHNHGAGACVCAV